jgi:hypothetical protein
VKAQILFLALVLPLVALAESGQLERDFREQLRKIHELREEYKQREGKITAEIKRLDANEGSNAPLTESLQARKKRLRTELKEVQALLETLEQEEREGTALLRELEAGRDATKGVSNICPVHNVQMRVVRAPIVYGLQMVRRDEFDARKREFPFARKVHWGGCVLQDYTEAKIYVCPKCQEAEKRWRKTHK